MPIRARRHRPATNHSLGGTNNRPADLMGQLWDAIVDNRIVVHYQPQVHMQTGELIGMEALARFTDTSGILHQPDSFIAAAEESGMIVGLGRAIARQACLDLAGWRRNAQPVRRVAINLSANQLNMDSQLCAFMADTLEETGLRFEDIEFELTERQLLESASTGTDVLAELAAAGARIALDDFGTGFSSLSYLVSLDVHTIKLDRELVQMLPDDQTASRIVELIVGMAKDLQLEVVAEGIESAAQQQCLAAMGCDLAQGFRITPPLPVDQLNALLTRH